LEQHDETLAGDPRPRAAGVLAALDPLDPLDYGESQPDVSGRLANHNACRADAIAGSDLHSNHHPDDD
jgi:hypothetical protein